jgi:hypothetical protein
MSNNQSNPEQAFNSQWNTTRSVVRIGSSRLLIVRLKDAVLGSMESLNSLSSLDADLIRTALSRGEDSVTLVSRSAPLAFQQKCIFSAALKDQYLEKHGEASQSTCTATDEELAVKKGKRDSSNTDGGPT